MNTTYKKVTITLPKRLQEDYRKVLSDLGITLSRRISKLIEEDHKKLSKVKL